MKRWHVATIAVLACALGALRLADRAPAVVTNYYVDPNYTGATRNGSQTNPWKWFTDSGAWSAINSSLASGPVNVYVSATSSTAVLGTDNQISFSTGSTYGSGGGRTDTGTNLLTFDGISEVDTISGGVTSWAATGVSLAPCEYGTAGCAWSSASRATISGTSPINSSNSRTNCQGYITVQGFNLQAIEGQIAQLTYTHDLTVQFTDITRVDIGSYGPGVYFGPGNGGPCQLQGTVNTSSTGNTVTFTAKNNFTSLPSTLVGNLVTINGSSYTVASVTGASTLTLTTSPGNQTGVAFNTFDGPDNVSILWNHVHATWGECAYDGASTPDPPGYQGTDGEYTGSGLNCQQNCKTGDNHLVQGNVFESCASWGGQGDGTDVKDGHTNLRVIGNTYRTSKPCQLCFGVATSAMSESGTTVTVTSTLNPGVGSGNVKIENATPSGYNGIWSVTSSSPASFQYTASTSGLASCSGGPCGKAIGPSSSNFCSASGIPGAGCDGQGPLFESGALVADNYIEAPGHQCSPIYSSWNNASGRGQMNLVNNTCVNANSATGNNVGFHWWPPFIVQGVTPPAWTGVSFYNNTAYNVGNGVVSLSGTVNTSGTSVTWASGNLFEGIMTGQSITINGTNYTVANGSCPPACASSFTALQLTTSAGSQSGVAYSFNFSNYASCIAVDTGGGGNGTNPNNSSTVENNILANCNNGGSGLSGQSNSGTPVIASRGFNDFYQATGLNGGACPSEPNPLCANPVFVSTAPPYADVNFQLQNTSTLKNAGANLTSLGISQLNSDYFGTARPGGATNWTPGFYAFPAAGTVATPTFSVPAGTYSANQSTVISSTTVGATIVYTTDGTTPGTGVGNCTPTGTGTAIASGSTLSINQTEIIKAIGCFAGDLNSGLASAAYTLQGSGVVFNPNTTGIYDGPLSVSMTQAQGLAICFTTDGTTPASDGAGNCAGTAQLYVGAISLVNTTNLQAVAVASGWTDSLVHSVTYTIVFDLAATISGPSGSGSVSDGSSFSCASMTCSTTYPPGTGVTLTATPTAGNVFVGWSGSCTGTGTCSLTMNNNYSVTATFASASPPTVQVLVSGQGGTVTSNVGGISCSAGGTGVCSATISGPVTFTATPVGGYFFAGWTNCPGLALTCALNVTQPIQTGAVFLQMNPALPRVWVDPNEGNNLWQYDFILGSTSWETVPPPACTNFALPYAANFTGLQAAVTAIEACRTTSGVGIKVKVPPGLYTTTNINGLVLPQTNSVYSTNFLILESTEQNMLVQGRPVCGHGVQPNLVESAAILLWNLDCTGKNLRYELAPTNTAGVISGITTLSTNTTTLAAIASPGVQCVPLANGYVAPGVAEVVDVGPNQETVTTTSAANVNGMCGNFMLAHASGVPVTFDTGSFTLANGLAANTSDYNDLRYMWTLENNSPSAAAAYVLQACFASGSSSLPHCVSSANIGIDHWIIRGAELRYGVGQKTLGNIVQIADLGNTSTSQHATHIHFRGVWAHGDWTSLTTGANSASEVFQLAGCEYCTVLESQVSQVLRPGAEAHAINANGAEYTFNDNVLIGPSSCVFAGGYSNTAGPPVSGWVPFVDVQMRGNACGYPFEWLGIYPINFNLHWTNPFNPVRKNAFELKEGMRAVIEGNYFYSSDNSGGQNGIIFDFNNWNNSSGLPGGNFQATIQDIRFANNFLSGMCDVFETQGAGRNVGGMTLPEQRVAITNNLFTGASTNNIGCGTATNVGVSLESSLNQWQGTVTECGLNEACFAAQCSVEAGTCQGQISSIGLGNTCSAAGTYSLTFSGGTQLPGGRAPVATAKCTGSPTATVTSFSILTGGFGSLYTAAPTATSGSITGSLGVTINSTNTMTPATGFSQYDFVPGQPVYVTNCQNHPEFNVATYLYGSSTTLTFPTALGPNASAYTQPTDLTVGYPWPPASASPITIGTTDNGLCTISNFQGGPQQFQMLHNTIVTDNAHALNSSNYNDQNNGPNYQWTPRLQYNIVLGGGWSTSSIGEGCKTANFNFDPLSSTVDQMLWVGRTQTLYNTCPMGANPVYPVLSPVAYFPATGYSTGASCSANSGGAANTVCFAGSEFKNASSMLLTVPDYHDFALDHTLGNASYYSAGQPGGASDGTDQGVSIPAIDAAATANTYRCPYTCGSPGPYPNVPVMSGGLGLILP